MEDTYKSRFTAAQIESALTMINSIAERSGIPCGTGEGSVTLLPMDNTQLSAAGEKIPTSAVVAKAIADVMQAVDSIRLEINQLNEAIEKLKSS